MPRKPGIWYRQQDNRWYTQINRKKQFLGDHPDGLPPPKKGRKGWNPPHPILKAFHDLMAGKLAEEPRVPSGAATRVAFTVIANAFLDRSQKMNAPETYQEHKLFLKSFARYVGKTKFSDLTPFQFNRWVESQPTWGDGGRRGAVNVVKACLNWWCDEHNIPSHPLQRLKAPPDRSRDGILSDADQQRVLDAIKPGDSFRDFFFALQQTGCRPSEVRRVCPEHLDAESGLWVMPGKTTRKTGKPRVVFLTPAVVELCQKLIAKNSDAGPIFRNRLGTPWTRSAVDYRFSRLAKKLNLPGLATYTLLRTFVTLGLERGVPVAQMATLAGHVDTKMVMKHYSKLQSQVQHMREQAEKAAGKLS